MENKKRLIDTKAKMIDKYLKARMISLDEALKATHNEIFWTESQQAAVRSFLLQLPKADAVEVVHGRWNESDWSGINIAGCMACSNCNVMIPRPDGNYYFLARLHYCPNCGARMDGDGNG